MIIEVTTWPDTATRDVVDQIDTRHADEPLPDGPCRDWLDKRMAEEWRAKPC